MSNVNDLMRYLHTLAKAPERTVDKIIFGQGDMEVKKLGTCWIASLSALEKAYQQGVNVVISHEPTFYHHTDLEISESDPPGYTKRGIVGKQHKGEIAYRETIERKKAWLAERDITVVRCHDVMDRVEKFGMAISLGRTLGFKDSDIIDGEEMYKIYRVEPDTAYNITKHMAQRLLLFNQPGIQFYGDRDRIVSSIGVGTGCYCEPTRFMAYGADYYLAIWDVVRTWTHTSFSNDSGLPLGVIDHGTSEEAGMRALCEHLNANYHECVHIDGGAEYLFVTPE